MPSFGETLEEAIEAIRDATLIYLNTLELEGERERVFAKKGLKIVWTRPTAERVVDVKAHLNEFIYPAALPLGKVAVG